MSLGKNILRVEVVQANGVADMDFAFAGDTDPYVVIEVEGQDACTTIKQGDLNPVWNEEFEFHITNPDSAQVNFLLWDDDVGADIIVASCSVNLNSLTENEVRGWELPLLRIGPEGRSTGSLQVNLTALNFNGLKVTMDMMIEQTKRLEATVTNLQQTEADLKQDVANLTELQGTLQERVGELEGLEKDLKRNVHHLAQQLKVMESEVRNLQKTRAELDKEVDKMEVQNDNLKTQLGDLRQIEEAMKAHAQTAGEDFNQFVEQMTSLCDKNQEQLDEFAEQNRQLKVNRQGQQVAALQMMSHNFQNWDGEAGLSANEFEKYISFLGPQYEAKIRERMGASEERPLGKLDADGSGELNVEEVRDLLDSVVKEVEEEQEE